jgi:hypothetical protein
LYIIDAIGAASPRTGGLANCLRGFQRIDLDQLLIRAMGNPASR